VRIGFTFDFSSPLDPTAAANSANYQLDAVTTRRIKKKSQPILHPIRHFTVSYTPASEAVTIMMSGKETFPKGGRLTVIGGVTGASGAPLAGATEFTIPKGGRGITPS
jgi:hypothetical protein